MVRHYLGKPPVGILLYGLGQYVLIAISNEAATFICLELSRLSRAFCTALDSMTTASSSSGFSSDEALWREGPGSTVSCATGVASASIEGTAAVEMGDTPMPSPAPGSIFSGSGVVEGRTGVLRPSGGVGFGFDFTFEEPREVGELGCDLDSGGRRSAGSTWLPRFALRP